MSARHWTIMKVWWQRGLTYRATWISYRFGETFEMLVLMAMWNGIFVGQTVVAGYSKGEMMTYVLLGSIFSSLVRSFAAPIIQREIHDGKLSAFLTKPISYLSYSAWRDVGRNVGPALLAVLPTSAVLIFLFRKLIIPNTDLRVIGLIALMLILALIIESLLQHLVGFITFWAHETEAIFDIVVRLKRFFTGGYFPLSLLPPALATAAYRLPFGYSYFVPAQLYLGKIDLTAGLRGLGIQAGWIILLYIIVKIVYARGLKKYEGTNM